MAGLGPAIHAFAGATDAADRAEMRRLAPAPVRSRAHVVEGRPKAGHDV